MKIAFVGANLSRLSFGVSAVMERLSAALVRAGQEVRVFGLEDDAWITRDRQAWQGAEAVACAVRGPARFGFAPQLAPALRDFGPDVIHAHGIWMYPSWASLQLARRGTPVVVSPHGMLDPWALGQARLKKRVAGWLYETEHLRRARVLHALNEAEADAIRQCGLRNPVAVVPNGIDLPGGPPAAAAPRQRPPWASKIPPGARVLLYLGRLHPKKNLPALLHAWAQVRTGSWHLVVAGPDQDGHLADLQAIVARLGMTSVSFVGPQFGADKEATLEAADAFVLPSLSEGLPMAILEAWASALPVLMTDACNLPAGFTAGAASRLATSGDRMVSEIERFLAMGADDMVAMGRQGRVLVESSFSWNRIADRFIDVYCQARPEAGGDQVS